MIVTVKESTGFRGLDINLYGQLDVSGDVLVLREPAGTTAALVRVNGLEIDGIRPPDRDGLVSFEMRGRTVTVGPA